MSLTIFHLMVFSLARRSLTRWKNTNSFFRHCSSLYFESSCDHRCWVVWFIQRRKKSVFVVESPCRMLVKIDWIDEFFHSPWNSLCAYYLMALKRNFEHFFSLLNLSQPESSSSRVNMWEKSYKLMQCRERSRSQLWRIKSSCHSDDVAFFNFKSHTCGRKQFRFCGSIR